MKKLSKPIIYCLLLFMILFGMFCRFRNMDWDSGALLHPDEYGLTNTLTRLRIPSTLSGYFNTRISPLSPYNKYDQFGETIEDGPDNTMRWGQLPMTLIRLAADVTGNTGYIELRRMGRCFSAVMDVLSLFLLYLLGKRLFDRTTALLAAALGSLCVMEIQQSHFMTVDNFGVFFSMLAVCAAVQTAQGETFARDDSGTYRLTKSGIRSVIRFGIFLGMAMACKINLAVLGVLLAPAVFLCAADLKLHSKADFSRLITLALCCALIAVLAMGLSFRLCQPMSFRNPKGDTHFYTFRFNPDWIRSMGVSANESKGIGGGPPSEQWAHRTPVLFALVNQVFYGMGTPLGVCVWVCMAFAWVRMFRSKEPTAWKSLLLPAFWGCGFFLFMSTRFVKNNRYFLPVYPVFCLIAAWGLLRLVRSRKFALAGNLLTLLVCAGTFVWANCFSETIYGQPHSRVEAVDWIYENVPSAVFLSGEDGGVPVPSGESEVIDGAFPFERSFRPYREVLLDRLVFPHASADGTVSGSVEILTVDGLESLSRTEFSAELSEDDGELVIPLTPFTVQPDVRCVIRIVPDAGSSLSFRRAVIANENWDEGLPFRLHNYDPFGQFYTGITNEVRWYDNDEKREMFIDRLTQAEYLILPSQRAIWSVCRIPKTYPMTMAYYEALFRGELGFELAAEFQRPFRLGPLTVSDLAGTIGTDPEPLLPINNRSTTAAEEAFSVYDHPPVWIFRKTADFSEEKLRAFFAGFDLSQVVVQGPTNAEW